MVHRHAEHAAGHRTIEKEEVGAAVDGETGDGRDVVVVFDDVATVCRHTHTWRQVSITHNNIYSHEMCSIAFQYTKNVFSARCFR